MMHWAAGNLGLIFYSADNKAVGRHFTISLLLFPLFLGTFNFFSLPFGLHFWGQVLFILKFCSTEHQIHLGPFHTTVTETHHIRNKKLSVLKTHVFQTSELSWALMGKLLNSVFKTQMENRNFHNHKLYKTIRITH